jgi:hypothetical protein
MREYKFKNGAHHGRGNDSPPRLYLVNKEGKYVKFKDSSIPGFCIVQNSFFTKQGKWSFTEFEILLFAGVTAWEMSSPYLSNPPTWESVYTSDPFVPKEVPLNIVKEVCAIEFPKGAAKLDERDHIAKNFYIVGSGYWQNDGMVHHDVKLNLQVVDTIIRNPQTGERRTKSGVAPEKYD